MKIVNISDTHGKLGYLNIPDGDILLHAGDSTKMGSIAEIEQFNRDLGNLPHKYKIVIAGNHDWGFQLEPQRARSKITNAIYLEDEMVNIEGLKIWGSPWQPYFFNWAFNLQRGAEIKQKWDLIPEDIDVLITHGPPFGIRDTVGPNRYNLVKQHVGCEELRKKVDTMKNLRLHVFGHIHLEHGVDTIGNTHFVNAASLDDYYQIAHNPIIVNL